MPLYEPYERRRPLSENYSDDDLTSSSPSYSSCDSISEVFDRYRSYTQRVRDMVNSLSDLDDSTVINQGTNDMRQPQLAFHTVHGQNVGLLRGNRIARRKESFCKGLAFSNRSIGVDENVCLRLNEVGTNWSGVLRFGVTNTDPETYRNIPVPKFACPDLTSKEGYWAKALPERYSVEGNILHFYVTQEGELYYGINGVHKGLFLVGINTNLPLWVIVDIYGNSVAMEFIDASDFRASTRSSRTASVRPPAIPVSPVHETSSYERSTVPVTSIGSRILEPLRFHTVTGRHVNLTQGRTGAERSENEYTQGYVFTERPISNNEKVVIQVTNVQQLYGGGLAFGITCCDPCTLRSADLPDDSSDLIEMPQYWVGIKDIALQPAPNTVISFWITDAGEVKMDKDAGFVESKVLSDSQTARTVLYVDNSLPLYMWFDAYGSTQAVKLLGVISMRARSPNPTAMGTRVALPTIPATTSRRAADLLRFEGSRSTSQNSNTPTLRVNMPTQSSNRDDETRTTRPQLPPRRTIDELLGGTGLGGGQALSADPVRTPPPLAPRPVHSAASLAALLPTPPARPPPPVPHLHSAPSSSASIPPIPTIPAPPVPKPAVARSTPAPLPQKVAPTASSEGDMDIDEKDECTVCMSEKINSVLYQCGHMCMCFDCAQMAFRSTGQCPLCREPIKDVIKFFKS